AREVDSTMAEVQRLPEMCHPSAAPDPHSVDRIDDRAHGHLSEEEAGERDAFGDGADDDVAGRLHEYHLEQDQNPYADVVASAALEEEAMRPKKAGASVA